MSLKWRFPCETTFQKCVSVSTSPKHTSVFLGGKRVGGCRSVWLGFGVHWGKAARVRGCVHECDSRVCVGVYGRLNRCTYGAERGCA